MTSVRNGGVVTRGGAGMPRGLRNGRGTSHEIVGPSTGLPELHVFHVVLEPRTAPGPYHIHRRASNVYIVLHGLLDVVVAGRTERLVAGDAITIAPGVAHATINPGNAPVIFLAIYDHPVADDFEEV